MNNNLIDTSVFVFKIGSIGDSIIALPAIRKIYNKYNQKLFFITNKPNNGVFPAWKIYKDTYYFEDAFQFEYTLKNILELKNYINSKCSKKILYYFVDTSSFKRNFRNYIFFKLIGFDEIYGWKECIGRYIKKDNNDILLEVEPEYKRLEKIVNKYLKLKEDKIFKYNFFDFNKNFVYKCKQKFDFLNDDFLVFGIGGKTKIQRWGIENYIYILNKLEQNYKIIILGGDSEKENAKYIKNKSNKEVINLCGKTSILESSYILKYSKCYVGNDTGAAHLAGIVGAKVFIISSARDNINRWKPYGKKNIIMRKRIECEGCWLHFDTCDNKMQCMTRIDKYSVELKLKGFIDEY